MPAQTVKAFRAKLSPFCATKLVSTFYACSLTEVQIFGRGYFFIVGVNATIRIEFRAPGVE